MEQQDVVEEETRFLERDLELNGLDLQFLYGSDYDEDLRDLRFASTKVDVLEINHSESGEATIKPRSLDEDQLCTWLDKITIIHANTKLKIATGLRLVLGSSSPPISAGQPPTSFPHNMKVIEHSSFRQLPFSNSTFKKIIQDFNLPNITP